MTDLNIRYEWRGPGYYASAQRGSYEEIHILIDYLDDVEEGDYQAASFAARVAGLGTPTWANTEAELWH